MRHIKAICIVLLFFTVHLRANEGIVRIGDRVFSKSDIETVMKTHKTLEPFTAMEIIKRKEMAASLAAKRKLDMRDPEKALYRDVIGEDIENDRRIKQLSDIPLHIKKPVLLREGMFEQWLSTLAENAIPVYIIDTEKLWEIFKQTDSYKVRAEHGHVIKPEHTNYTWAELSVDSSQVIATRNGKPFVNGSEFNAYLKKNKGSLELLGKRSKTLVQVQTDITRLMVGGKLLNEERQKKGRRYTEIEIEQAVSKNVQGALMHEDINLKGLQAHTLSEYMEIIDRRHIEKNKGRSNHLRAVLKDSIMPVSSDYEIGVLMMNVAYRHSSSVISKSILNDEIYEWMKVKRFRGSVDEARLALTRERQQKLIDELIKSEKVVVTVK